MKKLLTATLLLLATTLPASAAYPFDLHIVNQLPNRVWVTVYHNASIHWSGWVKGSMLYQTSQGNMRIMAEVAKAGDMAVHPQIVCKTDMTVGKGTKSLTIHYSPGSNCYWQPQ
jgi:hypothetical protein